jgi:hypothetical protein
VLGELDGETVAPQSELLDTSRDERLGQLRPLLGRASAPYIAHEKGGRLRLAGAAAPQAALAEIPDCHGDLFEVSDRDGDLFGPGLHDAGEDVSETPGQAPLVFGRMVARNVQLQVVARNVQLQVGHLGGAPLLLAFGRAILAETTPNIAEITAEAVPLGPGQRLSLPLAALVLLVLSIGAGGLALKPGLLPRMAWIGGLLSSVAVYEVRIPFAGPPKDEAATKIVTQLAGNLHNAVLFREESKLHDAMILNVAPDKLEEVLLEAQRALSIEIQGGGAARVEGVEDVVVKDIEGLDNGGFRALTEWRADASAGHWGHLQRWRRSRAPGS